MRGPITKITTNKTVSITGGIKVTFAYSTHKARGRLGMWGFSLARSGATEDIELRSEQAHFQAEVDAHGALLVFRHVDYNTFEIVLAAAKTPKPLGDDGCRAEIEKAATARKLPVGGSSSSSYDGIVTVSTAAWIGHCGEYKRRVWFTPPRHED